MTHYIVGLDLTDDSSYALSWAYKNLFNDSDLVTVVTVLPGWTAEADIDPVSPSKYTPEMIQDEALATERARNIVLEMEKTHTEKHVEAYFRVIHADRDPKEALCNVAVNLKGHTLVIGHGLNKNSGFGQWVLDHSRIPVVVVRPTHLEI
ncbi:uncharacterized protein BJ171DRAFT_590629 [Polychytrium aggregatum]|uniref:uncharacterized protein n=1 Tax=Polychytrium aggregatum TaxID=110093 RepID=UPI0022FEAFCA|nr:uncharacterized protein BJ171DRAFT_590629 [Polychytrium aggregatum]KAI9190815.1 hypothetical protein BJ171DRAFT_590629 [Polychytrium aggregatum]